MLVITSASVDDREGLRDMAENRLGLVILGDKGYTGERLYESFVKLVISGKSHS